MARFQNRFLLMPLLLLGAAFLIEKIFFIPWVRERTQPWQKIEPTFYKSREALFKQLLRDYPKRVARNERLGLVLGTSRAGDFNARDIARLLPGSYAYNFSAPAAGHSYHYYWLDKIIRAGMKPSFVLIETDPMLFSPFSERYALSYSYDMGFMMRNTRVNRPRPRDPASIREVFAVQAGGFSVDETETFLLKRMFALYRYPPNLQHFWKNRRKQKSVGFTGHEIRRWVSKNMKRLNRENLGGIANPLMIQESPEKIAKAARAEGKKHLENYRPSLTQAHFFNRILDELARRRVPTVLYWPMAPEAYRKIVDRLGLTRKLQDVIRERLAFLRKKYPDAIIILKDPQHEEKLTCRSFIDVHHLSGKCYPRLTEYLLKDLRRTFPAR